MMPNMDFLKSYDPNEQFETTKHRLEMINQRLQKIASSEDSHELEKAKDSADWTKSYQVWGQWNEKELLTEIKSSEEAKLETLKAQADNMGHVHDHTDERDFFQLPEHLKFQTFLDYRSLGNYLVWEGNYIEAITAYETALGYYEYCFPEEVEKQQELDNIRIVCFCNVALCYIRTNQYREAIEACSNAIRESKGQNPKAFFRRAQAFRFLDEYPEAKADLTSALELAPTDKSILEEMKTVQQLEEKAKVKQNDFALNAFQRTEVEKKDKRTEREIADDLVLDKYLERFGLPSEFDVEMPLDLPAPPASLERILQLLEHS